MMVPGPRRSLAAAGLFLALPAAASGLLHILPAAPPPLTNEDIVRLVTHGTPESTILREMESRAVEFDLSPGVVEELAHVGVSPSLIEAMRRRQAAMPRPAEPAAPPGGATAPAPGAPPGAPAVPVPTGRLSVVFETRTEGKGGTEGQHAADAKEAKEDKEEPDAIMAITSLPKGAPRPEEAEIGTVTELALAILCTSGDHVPDHWDTRTPLKGAPRHELLLFRPGSTSARRKGFDVIVLNREPAGPIPLPVGAHALVVGLAGKQSGSGAWLLLASDAIRVEARAGVESRLVLDARSKLIGSRMIGFKLDQIWKLRQDPEAPPAGAS